MTDRILLQNMRFEATHGYHEYEQHIAQPFEVDIEFGSTCSRPASTTT